MSRARVASLVALASVGTLLAVANVYRWVELQRVEAAWKPKPTPGARERAKGQRQLDRCKQNLHRIYLAIQGYREDSGGAYPWALAACGGSALEASGVLYPKYVSDKSTFICPGDKTAGARFPACRDVPCSYWYLLGNLFRKYPEVDRAVREKLLVPFGKDLIIFVCVGNHNIESTGVPASSNYLAVRADGRTGWVGYDDALFARMRGAHEQVSRLTEKLAQRQMLKVREGLREAGGSQRNGSLPRAKARYRGIPTKRRSGDG